MNALILFFSTFVLVFGLGLQSQNVNGGHYKAAFLTSFLIGGGQMVLLKLGPEANMIEIVAYLSGGPIGIVCSMWVHRRTLGRTSGRTSSRPQRAYGPRNFRNR